MVINWNVVIGDYLMIGIWLLEIEFSFLLAGSMQ